jgi:hypothetical protein
VKILKMKIAVDRGGVERAYLNPFANDKGLYNLCHDCWC